MLLFAYFMGICMSICERNNFGSIMRNQCGEDLVRAWVIDLSDCLEIRAGKAQSESRFEGALYQVIVRVNHRGIFRDESHRIAYLDRLEHSKNVIAEFSLRRISHQLRAGSCASAACGC